MSQALRSAVLLCLDRAGECERLAELIKDGRLRETYLRIARQWRALAGDREFVEQMDRLLRLGDRREAAPAPASAWDSC
jgi:hypothetical protein